jgi:NDP-sugar pyrophosphorylase family protein
MKAVLICPSERDSVQLLAEPMPLSNVPLLGQGLVEYWLAWLATERVTEVSILAHDRAEQVRALAGKGERWGLKVEVISESRELTPAQALIKYEERTRPTPLQNGIVVLDHFPGLPQLPLFDTYANCFAAMQHWMPRAVTPERVGIREVSPGVWAGSHSQISPLAELRAPCWLGRKTFVGPRAVLGPHTIVENGCFIEGDTQIEASYVGPDTFVGRYAELAQSLAWGRTLINWKSGSITQVPDPFLLCALRSSARTHSGSWFSRVSQLYSRNKEEVQLLWKHLLMDRES